MNSKKLEELVGATSPLSPPSPRPAMMPYVAFPVEVLPEPVCTFVRVASTSIGCDPVYVALPVLAALASLIGNSRRILLKAGWSEPMVIWAAIVGESGTLKSPAYRAAMKPIRDLQRDEMRAFDDRLARYERDKVLYEKDLAAWKKSGSGDPPEQPVRPQPARFIVSDTTVEALLPILKDNWRGVLLARDEIGGWLASFDRYANAKGADAAHWLSMFNADSVICDRKTGLDKIIMVDRASVSIVGGIQPGTLRRAIGIEHRENGLLARFLVAIPPRRRRRWTDAGIPPDVEAQLGGLCDGLRAMQPEHLEDQCEPVIVRLTPAAKRRWVEFFNAHAHEQFELTGDLCASWSKLECYAARFTLLMHCIRVAAGDPSIENDICADESSVDLAITLTRWFCHESRRFYAMLDENEDDQARRHLVEMIARSGGSTSVRQWQQRRSPCTSAEAESELADLEAHGYGHLGYAVKKGPGPKPKIFTLYSDPPPDTNTYELPPDEAPEANSYVLGPSGPRREVAHLLRMLRRMGHRDRAIDIRDEWRERLAIASVEAGLTEAEAQAVALSAVAAMSIGPTGLSNGWSMSQGASP